MHALNHQRKRAQNGRHCRLVDFVVCDQPDAGGGPRDDHHVVCAQPRHDVCHRDLLDEVHEADVALHRPLHLEATDLSHAGGELVHSHMVQVQHRVDLLHGHQRRRRQHARLAHGAPAGFPQPPALGDKFVCADDDGAHGRTEALGQAHRHGVGGSDTAPRGHAQRCCGVPDARAVYVQLDANLPRELAALVHVLQRQHAPPTLVVCLLDAQHARGGKVLIVHTHRAAHFVKVHSAIILVGDGAGVSAHEGGQPALLVNVDVA
mmetsp:Transcript_9561/g.23608  ORF Transcript_9561/g.23608 Transcript_9561/m.23608 type:complete len:263 (-) Transcript_9561:509-1297(-)